MNSIRPRSLSLGITAIVTGLLVVACSGGPVDGPVDQTSENLDVAAVPAPAPTTTAPDKSDCPNLLNQMMWGNGTMAPLRCCPHVGNPSWTQLDYIKVLKLDRDALADAQAACDAATAGSYITGIASTCVIKWNAPGAVLGIGSTCFALQSSEYCALAARIRTTIDWTKACLQLEAGGP